MGPLEEIREQISIQLLSYSKPFGVFLGLFGKVKCIFLGWAKCGQKNQDPHLALQVV
jgi:hypothetical protein